LVKGRVHTFLQEKIGGDAFQLQACTNTIISLCRIRNKKLATDVKADVQDIINQKGLTRTDVESWLKEIEAEKKAPDWGEVQNLLGENVPFLDLKAVRNAYTDYRIKALDAGNDAQNAVVRQVKESLVSMTPEIPLWTFIEQLIVNQNLMDMAEKNGHTLPQLRAIIIYEIFKPE
jgi:hypothetical protein